MLKTLGAAVAAAVLHLLYCSPSISSPSAFDFSAFQHDPTTSSPAPNNIQPQNNLNSPVHRGAAAPLSSSPDYQRHSRQRRHRGRSASNQSAFANADLSALRQFAVELINRDRSKHGAPPVLRDEGLDKVAQAYAEYLAQSGFFGHVDPFGRNPQDRATLYGVTKRVSENLAWGSSNYQTPEALLSQSEHDMMAEPPNQMNHRYNIVNPRNRTVGVGVAILGEKVILVQEFSTEGN